MGMESFYVRIKFESKKKYFENISSLSEFFSDLDLEVSKNSDFFVLDEKVILNVFENGTHTEVSFEGCFSWYEECLNYIYSIFTKIKEKDKMVKMVWPKEHLTHKLDRNLFLEEMNILYEEKYKDFISQYGKMNKVILPREYFYSSQNRNTKKWTSIFRRSKSD